MSGDFLDSNVFIYLFDDTDTERRAIAESVVTEAIEDGASISFQVVQETLRVITEKLPVPVDTRGASAFLSDTLRPLWDVMPSDELYQRGLALQARYGFGFYDALIVAAALECGCDRLLSEDLQHGQSIEGLTVVNPFAIGRDN